LLNGIAILGLAAIFFLFPGSPDIIVIGIFITYMLASTIISFFGPAISAAIPDIVPKSKVTGANSMGQISGQLSQFLGPGIGPQLISILGYPLLVLLDGVSYLFSAISEIFIKIPQEIPEKSKKLKDQFLIFKQDIGEGLNFIMKNPGLKRLVLISVFISFFATPITILLPFFVRDFLNANDNWLGAMMIAFGLGNFFGFMSAGIFKIRGGTRCKIIILFLILQGLGYILLGLVHIPYHAVIITFAGGIVNGFILINITTILQLTTPSNIRGRVLGVLTTISISIMPLGMGLSGYIADLLDQNIPLLYIISGASIFFLSLYATSGSAFRKFISYEAKEEMEPTGFTYNIRTLGPSELYVINQIKEKE
jgi:MFS family permease